MNEALKKEWLARWRENLLADSKANRYCDREMGEEIGWLVSPFLNGFYYGYLATGDTECAYVFARDLTRRREAERETKGAKPPAPARSGPSKNSIRRASELEREVEKAEASLAALEDELADPTQWSSPTRRERATERHAKAKRAVEQAYAAWEDATG